MEPIRRPYSPSNPSSFRNYDHTVSSYYSSRQQHSHSSNPSRTFPFDNPLPPRTSPTSTSQPFADFSQYDPPFEFDSISTALPSKTPVHSTSYERSSSSQRRETSSRPSSYEPPSRPSSYEGGTSAGATKRTKSRTSRCLTCRNKRLRCVRPAPDASKCHLCLTLNVECSVPPSRTSRPHAVSSKQQDKLVNHSVSPHHTPILSGSLRPQMEENVYAHQIDEEE